MRLIGTLADESEARTIGDYLQTQSIPSRLVEGRDGWELWVYQEDQVEPARVEFERFRANPKDERYQGNANRARAMRKEAERAQRRHYEESYDARYFWGPRDFRRCPAAWILIGLSVFTTLVTEFGNNDRIVSRLLISTFDQRSLDHFGADVPAGWHEVDGYLVQTHLRQNLAAGEVWRLITPIFLHFSVLHLFFDMYWLYALGCEIEARRGTRRFVMIVLMAAVVSNLAQYLVTRWPQFGGMSGVDLALFGYVWMKGMYEPENGLSLSPQTVMLMLFYVVFSIATEQALAHAAHLAGLFLGVVIGLLPSLLDSMRPRLDQ